MRSALLLAGLLATTLALGACTTTRGDGSPRVQTTSEANRESLQGAVAAPLRDVNVLRTKIPPVLLEAIPDPYARPRKLNCQALYAMVKPLDDALGPDLDLDPEPDETLAEQGREGALGLVAGAASDVIPFRSWVRRLTGAERHDKLVQQAIKAGSVRRAYLKGLGESKGCHPPATPQHKPPQAAAEPPHKGPRYPIR